MNPITRAALSPLTFAKRGVNHFWISRAALRRAQETLFAEPPWLEVPEFEGVFRVTPRSDLFKRLLEHGVYEPIHAELCRTWIDPARDAVDVGANIGFFTVLAAKHTRGRVLAVEPTDKALNLLRQNIERNGVADRVTFFQGIAGAAAGEVLLNVIEGKEEYSSRLPIGHAWLHGEGEAAGQKVVASATLDELVEHHRLDPGFIKIDAEGTEQHVIDGAARTLANARPVVLSELVPHLLRKNGRDPGDYPRSLKQHGYRLIDPIVPTVPVARRTLGDLLAVPEERYTHAQLLDLLQQAHARVAERRPPRAT